MKKQGHDVTQIDEAGAIGQSSILNFNRYGSAETRLLATRLADQIAISGVVKQQDLPVAKSLVQIRDEEARLTLESNVAKALGRHFDVQGRINITIRNDRKDSTQYRVIYSYRQAA